MSVVADQEVAFGESKRPSPPIHARAVDAPSQPAGDDPGLGQPVFRLVFWLLIALGLVYGARTYAPQVQESWAWIEAQDDPVALTGLGLARDLTPSKFHAEIAAALDADDIDLAESFFELGRQQGLSAPPDLEARYRDATSTAANVKRNAAAFWDGLSAGEANGGAGLAGVVVADVSGVGDVRDLVREGGRLARGEEADRLTLGLAAAGLVVTGATIASVGAAMPARTGVSTLKAAARSGRLSKPLAATLGRSLGEAFDENAIKLAAGAAAKLDLTGAQAAVRQAIRPAGLARLRVIAEDVGTIGKRMGVRGTQEALALARDPAELRRIARVAEARGGGARAALRVLGRGALAIGAGIVTFAGWVMAAVGWLWMALLVCSAFARRIARIAWWLLARAFQVIAYMAGLVAVRWRGGTATRASASA